MKGCTTNFNPAAIYITSNKFHDQWYTNGQAIKRRIDFWYYMGYDFRILKCRSAGAQRRAWERDGSPVESNPALDPESEGDDEIEYIEA